MRLLVIVSTAWLAACSGAPTGIVITGHIMGTQYNLKIAQDVVDEVRLGEDVEAVLREVDDLLSTYRPDTDISQFNASRSTDWLPVSATFCDSVQEALELSELTDGAFDITVAPLVNLWGFGPDAMIDEPPADDDIASALAAVGYRHLSADCSRPALKKGIAALTLDMSAFGKGLAVDEVAQMLDESGVRNYLIEVGGEIRLRGHNIQGNDWAIGIEKPLDDARQPGTIVHLTDTAMATSGDYRNYFEAGGKRYSHTIDTRTGRPVTHALASVTVVDARGSRADALATALLVLGPQDGVALAERENLAALFLVRTSAGFDEIASPAFRRLRSEG